MASGAFEITIQAKKSRLGFPPTNPHCLTTWSSKACRETKSSTRSRISRKTKRIPARGRALLSNLRYSREVSVRERRTKPAEGNQLQATHTVFATVQNG